VLVAEQSELFGRRPDPRHPGHLDLSGEAGVLRQEAVAGVDAGGAELSGRVEQLVAVEVALGRRRRAQAHGGVGFEHVRRGAVGIGVHGQRADPHPSERADDADGDLAPVGDQYRVDHRWVRGPSR
jgi:hypothetical protein